MQLSYLRKKCQKLFYKSQERKSLTTSSPAIKHCIEVTDQRNYTKCLCPLPIHIQIHSYPQYLKTGPLGGN